MIAALGTFAGGLICALALTFVADGLAAGFALGAAYMIAAALVINSRRASTAPGTTSSTITEGAPA